jgi:putative phosphoesterase
MGEVGTMKIGILSDTHDQLHRAARAVAILAAEGAEALIHCGDLTTPEVVYACVLPDLTCHYVLGNNDYDERGIRLAIEATGGVYLGWGGEITLAGRRIAVTHGDDTRLFRRLLAAQPDYLLSGHTHVPLNERDGLIRQVNPGALYRAREYTVAVLDLERDTLRFVKIA